MLIQSNRLILTNLVVKNTNSNATVNIIVVLVDELGQVLAAETGLVITVLPITFCKVALPYFSGTVEGPIY